jgi:hypothetical protein
MSKGVESVSVTAFPAAAVMDDLSKVQLAMVLLLLVLAISSLVLTVLMVLLVALVALVSTTAANKERWTRDVATGATMLRARIMQWFAACFASMNHPLANERPDVIRHGLSRFADPATKTVSDDDTDSYERKNSANRLLSPS